MRPVSSARGQLFIGSHDPAPGQPWWGSIFTETGSMGKHKLSPCCCCCCFCGFFRASGGALLVWKHTELWFMNWDVIRLMFNYGRARRKCWISMAERLSSVFPNEGRKWERLRFYRKMPMRWMKHSWSGIFMRRLRVGVAWPRAGRNGWETIGDGFYLCCAKVLIIRWKRWFYVGFS